MRYTNIILFLVFITCNAPEKKVDSIPSAKEVNPEKNEEILPAKKDIIDPNEYGDRIVKHFKIPYNREKMMAFHGVSLRTTKDYKAKDGRKVTLFWYYGDFTGITVHDLNYRATVVFKEGKVTNLNLADQKGYPLGMTYNDRYGEKEYRCIAFKDGFSKNCDYNIKENKEGQITFFEEYPKCPEECLRYTPFRLKEEHLATQDDVLVLEKPNTSANVIAKLKKNAKVMVLEDLFQFERIGDHFATWTKVRMEDGKMGYIFGADLRTSYEPDIEDMIERAKKWKAKGGNSSKKQEPILM